MVVTMVLSAAEPVPVRAAKRRFMPLTVAQLEARFPPVLLVEVTAADHAAASKADARSAESCALSRAALRAGGYGWAWTMLETVEVGDEDGRYSLAPGNFVSGVYQLPAAAVSAGAVGTFRYPRLRIEQWSP